MARLLSNEPGGDAARATSFFLLPLESSEGFLLAKLLGPA
jgi:hypothetical protein